MLNSACEKQAFLQKFPLNRRQKLDEESAIQKAGKPCSIIRDTEILKAVAVLDGANSYFYLLQSV